MSETFEAVIQKKKFVILDTETTGLRFGSEIVSIAIIDHDGNVLLDTLVKPVQKIPSGASAIHGIKDEDVASAPSWLEVGPKVMELVKDRDVVIYNAGYDTMIMASASEAAGLEWNPQPNSVTCAMEWYAEIWGDVHPYYQTYRWQTLSNAMKQQGIKVQDAHHALGDVRMTLALINKLVPAALDPVQPTDENTEAQGDQE